MQGFLDNPHSLPDTMSGLLATAIDDARQLDRTLYHPRCGEWHTAWEHRPCQVCLAGSVIAGSLGASHHQTLYPNIFRGPVQHKLESIDFMRRGKWVLAFKAFYQLHPKISASRQLNRLPRPDNKDFNGWQEFDSHLDSLEEILPDLRQIEQNERIS